MARNNFVFVSGNITGDIYFEREYEYRKKVQPYICMYLMINGTTFTPAVKGLRIVAVGPLAELTYGFVPLGSEIAVFGHIEVRVRKMPGGTTTTIVEVIAEDIKFLRNVNNDKGMEIWKGLVEEGKMGSSRPKDQNAPAGGSPNE